jgi:hypothetical protein
MLGAVDVRPVKIRSEHSSIERSPFRRGLSMVLLDA